MFKFDAVDETDPEVLAELARAKKYGWATNNEIYTELSDFKCWACDYWFKFEGKPVRLLKSRYYSLICPSCGVRNYPINPEEQNEEQDLKDIEGVL